MSRRILVACLLGGLSGTVLAGESLALKPLTLPDTPANRLAGARTIIGVCHGCHDLKYLSYESFIAVGIGRDEIDALRGDEPVSAPFLSRMSKADRLATFGRLPPDLSIMARAREGGPAYIYTLLTSFRQGPDWTIDNTLFPGIKMPDILGIAATGDDPAQRQAIERKAQQAALFLEWAADPHADERRRLGVFVLLYLGVLSGLLYRIKKRIWARLDGVEGRGKSKE